ncbi:MAG: DUF4344 domain-containing metallopeptidase [Candidatus Nitrosocaldus sp.]|nr:DUF4344 domain-containing metallopeptidase [Candidatus Nitrosocaldus sp.]
MYTTMLMRRDELVPLLLAAMVAVAVALGIASIFMVYSLSEEINQYESRVISKSDMYAKLDELGKRYDAMDERVKDMDSSILELKGIVDSMSQSRDEVVSRQMQTQTQMQMQMQAQSEEDSINGNSNDGNSSNGNDVLRDLLESSVRQRGAGSDGREVEDTGDFVIMYMDTDRYSSVRSILLRSGVLDMHVDTLNDRFILPHDVRIVVGEDDRCRSASGYYEQASKRIVLCYSSINRFMALHPDDAERFSTLVKFLLYHEAAHALMDAYTLPIVGVEYAADNFAVVMMLNDGDDIHPLIWLYDAMREDKLGRDARYWDTHMLFVQRYYDILCLAYGKDPSRYDGSDLPYERAYRCSYEYSSALNAWSELLRPWIKNGS